ncbi:septin-4 isoform X2 [Phasianus colchicus]|uniref:septin-4 isoform X2 n=1 Tax=Phasianus colchicus TaxID=9054 RepID=UPI00129E3581|nr:septin-4 isoform X2 [Phasianus colchicus]
MAPNPLLPPDSATLQGPSATIPQPRGKVPMSSYVPELPQRLQGRRPMPSGRLVVALQRPLGEQQQAVGSRLQPGAGQGQSSGHSVTFTLSDLSRAEPPSRGCPPCGSQVATAILKEQMTQTEPCTVVLSPHMIDVGTQLPQDPCATHPTVCTPTPPPPRSPITNPKPPRRALRPLVHKSISRCSGHQDPMEQGSLSPQPPPAQPSREQNEHLCVLHHRAEQMAHQHPAPFQLSPPTRDMGTQASSVPVNPHPDPRSPKAPCACCPQHCPAVPLPWDVSTTRALSKPDRSSAWWPLLHSLHAVTPCPVSPVMEPSTSKSSPVEVDAIAEVPTGRGGFSEDVAMCDRAPATTLLQDNGSKNFACGVDVGHKVDKELATEFKTTFMDEEIKRFLKEDSEEAELTQFLRDCPPADSPRKVEPPEGRRDSGHPLCGRAPGEEPTDEHDVRSFSRPRPLDTQQLIMAPPPPSPSRPRSPWGQLDPYDSSEDDKEYVGFATLPNQVHRKSVKKGFDFTLMVAGESGLGKSTLVNSLFLTDMYRDRKLLNAEERITQTVEITKHVVDIEEKGVKLRLTIVDTPGFGDAVNNTECWKPVADYIDQQFEQYFRDESGLNRKNIQDNRVHCCIYFISPFGHGLRPLDVEFMRALHQRVNIVPVLAKADTLTPAEVERMKNKIREEIDHYGIRIYQFPECDSDEDEEFKLQDQALKESIPFAVIGSNTVVEAKGRRVRGRLYPWGIVEVENPSHCDFVKLRTMLVRTHMQDLKDVTRETHYENYRTQCIQSMTRMVVKERNRNKLTRESGTDFPIPVIPPVPDSETEKLIREKDEELRRMQEMLQKIQKQMKDSH